jgi:2-desacetyl-2-hydroxyethyl bacteriochlorophyllide A dehydrogenase
MSGKMKAAVLRRPMEMVVEEVSVPEPKAGWVRLKTCACGICGSDMHIYTGNHPWLKPGHPMEQFVLGNVYGHEIAGVVDALGVGVKGVREGDRVAVNAIVPCLKCPFCRVGLYQNCANLEHYGFHHPGGFAEYTLVPLANVLPIPEGISFQEAVLLDVLVVGVHAVQMARVTIPDRVGILGAGPIGLAMAAVVRKAGARETWITTRHSLQKDLARKIGINIVLDAEPDLVIEEVLRRTGGLGLDCVLESVGYRSKTIQLALELVRKRGRIVFTGVFEEELTLNFGTLLIKEAEIRASHAFGMWDLVPELELAVQLMADGTFPARDLVTHTFPIEKINEAFQVKLRERDRALKVEILF